MAGLANHLWQSTMFGAAVWMITLALRKNRAAVRYRLWLAASVKFLVPFALLIGLGSRVEWRTAPAAVAPRVPVVVEQIARPFTIVAEAPVAAVVSRGSRLLPTALSGVWLCGVLLGLTFWLRAMRQIRAIRHAATPLRFDLPVPVLSSLARMEPGVFGIRKPVLILPAGIDSRLTPAQLEAVLAHELCHVRRRDNLTAAIHLVVEILFWFHPLVWWIRTRLVAERERACDEAVVAAAGNPEEYAAGILNVCRFYLESPAAVARVTGADLKKRIAEIVEGRVGDNLAIGKRMLVTAVMAAAVGGPFAIGLLHVPGMYAQAKPSFELASVKLMPAPKDWPWPDGFSMTPKRSGDRVAWVTGPGALVRYAYNLPQFEVAGTLPKDAFYRIDAKTDPATTDEQLRQKFQTLLADRFQFVFHRETRELKGYSLAPGKNGPKIKEYGPQDKPAPLPEWFAMKGDAMVPVIEGRCLITREGPSNALTGRRVSMRRLADTLQEQLNTFVLDETGLKGDYYFGVRFLRDGDARKGDVVSDAPDLGTALQEQLGLKLEKSSASVEILLIDHMEKSPSEN